jgi:holliday junction DNA helicase RuvA
MYEFLQGTIQELTPTYAVLECGSTGWLIHISLQTYSQLQGKKETRLFVHQIIREDAQLFYGFAEKTEREMFRLLIGVSGVGAATARLLLSSLSAHELQQAIVTGNLRVLQGVKGIGLKSAERLVVELRDKFGKIQSSDHLAPAKYNTSREEALSALVTLGFARNMVEKLLDKIIVRNPQNTPTVEELIKQALREM